VRRISGSGRPGHELTVDLAGPEEVEILFERAAAGCRRSHEAEQDADLDRPVPRSDIRPDRQRPDRELGLGLGGDEDLPVRGARRRDEHERREDRALRS
jgi:hypothetical protein